MSPKKGGGYELAPNHMAFPTGWETYFGFVCTPHHNTYHNARREGVFTVSYPRPTQIVLASLAASPREGPYKPALDALRTFPAAFSAMGATRESIVEAAKEDYAEFIRDRSVVGPPGSSGAPDFETQLIDQSA